MIIEDRSAYFSRHQVEPCKNCLKRDTPGSGVGPIISSLLLDVHTDAEIERLERKASMNGVSDNWDKVLAERSRAIFVRACWLANIDPDQANAIAQQAPRPLAA